jgi:hypothetical protein
LRNTYTGFSVTNTDLLTDANAIPDFGPSDTDAYAYEPLAASRRIAAQWRF